MKLKKILSFIKNEEIKFIKKQKEWKYKRTLSCEQSWVYLLVSNKRVFF